MLVYQCRLQSRTVSDNVTFLFNSVLYCFWCFQKTGWSSKGFSFASRWGNHFFNRLISVSFVFDSSLTCLYFDFSITNDQFLPWVDFACVQIVQHNTRNSPKWENHFWSSSSQSKAPFVMVTICALFWSFHFLFVEGIWLVKRGIRMHFWQNATVLESLGAPKIMFGRCHHAKILKLNIEIMHGFTELNKSFQSVLNSAVGDSNIGAVNCTF